MKQIPFRDLFSTRNIILLLILIVSFASFIRVGDCNFLFWDDDMLILKNPYVRYLTWESITHNFAQERFTALTLSIYSFMYKLWGNNPAPYHWLNLIIHLANIVLVFKLMQHFFKNIYSVILVSLLFALHPLRVESVAWVSELKGLLCTFFILSSVLFYIKYLQSNRKWFLFALAAFLAILSSFSKIQGIITPLLWLLLDIYFRRKDYSLSIVEKLVMLIFPLFTDNISIMATLLLVITVAFLFKDRIDQVKKMYIYIGSIVITLSGIFILFLNFGSSFTNFWNNQPENQIVFSFTERILLAGFSLWFYFRSFFYPFPMSAFHPYPMRNTNGSLPAEFYITTIVMLAFVAIAIYFIIRRNKINNLIFFGFFFFIITISLYLHIIPIEGRIIAADRYSYLPHLGLFILLALVFEKLIFRHSRFNIFSTVFLAILSMSMSIAVYSRTKVWTNTQTLFQDVVTKDPTAAFAYLNLAASHLQANQTDSAINCFNKSIQLDSLNINAYYNRGLAYSDKKNYKMAMSDFNSFVRLAKSNKTKAIGFAQIGELYRASGKDSIALSYFNQALHYDSTLSIAYNKRGIHYLNIQDYGNALQDFEKAIKFNHFNSEAINNKGMVLLLQGHIDESILYFSEALRLSPEYVLAYDNRAYAYSLAGDNDNALKDYNKEIDLNPNNVEVYIKRGRVFASMKQYQDAIRDFDRVLQRKPTDFIALTNRAYAYYYSDQFEKARTGFSYIAGLYPENAASWQNMGWYFMQVKEYANALSAFEKSIRIDTALINS